MNASYRLGTVQFSELGVRACSARAPSALFSAASFEFPEPLGISWTGHPPIGKNRVRPRASNYQAREPTRNTESFHPAEPSSQSGQDTGPREWSMGHRSSQPADRISSRLDRHELRPSSSAGRARPCRSVLGWTRCLSRRSLKGRSTFGGRRCRFHIGSAAEGTRPLSAANASETRRRKWRMPVEPYRTSLAPDELLELSCTLQGQRPPPEWPPRDPRVVPVAFFDRSCGAGLLSVA